MLLKQLLLKIKVSKTNAFQNDCFSKRLLLKLKVFKNKCFPKRLLLQTTASQKMCNYKCTCQRLHWNCTWLQWSLLFSNAIFCCAWIICTNLNSVGEQSETEMHWNTVNCTASSFWNRKPTFQPLLSSSLKAAKGLAWRVMHQKNTVCFKPPE